ncbi:hypothetical protein [Salinarchaeum laminariae]|uniref:hypothetical protein n=1 Tax=Salinarchaeum laminariae TaxID=869888 RepID=UPI0020C0A86E|nr:hypothetical protein [Salinarchaeum laminariae]
MTGLLKRAVTVYREKGVPSLLRESSRFAFKKTIRPHLPCRDYPKIRGISVMASGRCTKMFDNIIGVDFSWPDHHKEPNCNFISKYVHEGDSVVIVGGGYGITSVVAGQQVGKGGKVFIYEAAKEIVDDLLSTLEQNGVSKQTTVKHAVVGDAIDLKGLPGNAKSVSPSNLPSCEIAELDCEGAEVNIIPHLTRDINKIIVETHPSKGASTDKVKAILRKNDWEIIESAPDRSSGEVLVAG